MSNLSELLPAGGAAKEIEAVASGTLPNGTPVIIKSDGTVEVIVETTNTISQAVPLGSETQFDSHGDWIGVKYDPFNAGRFVIAWQDAGNSGYGSMIVGNTSGGTITFGSQGLAIVNGLTLRMVQGEATTSVDDPQANIIVEITYS